jgi:hypothetical protein
MGLNAMATLEFSIPIPLKLSKPLIDVKKLKFRFDGRISYFIYQQDGSKQEMSCPDTQTNRFCVAWFQIRDSPTTGHEAERKLPD